MCIGAAFLAGVLCGVAESSGHRAVAICFALYAFVGRGETDRSGTSAWIGSSTLAYASGTFVGVQSAIGVNCALLAGECSHVADWCCAEAVRCNGAGHTCAVFAFRGSS